MIFALARARLLLAQPRTTWPGSHALSRNPSGRRKTKQTRESRNSAWTPLKTGPYYLQQGSEHQVRHEGRRLRGRSRGEWRPYFSVWLDLRRAATRCVDAAEGGLASELTAGRLLLCVELQLGWGRGRTEAILTVSCGWKGKRYCQFRVENKCAARAKLLLSAVRLIGTLQWAFTCRNTANWGDPTYISVTELHTCPKITLRRF